MCADFAIHDKADGNPHAHVLLTTRDVNTTGFGKKNRDWNEKGNLKSWRESWAVACNERLQAKGHSERIDHRTLEAQGINREPTKHIGVAAKYMERKGLSADRARVNQGIIARNTAKQMHELKENYIAIDKEISSLQGTAAEARREANSLRIKAEEILERAEHIQNMRQRLDETRAGRHDRQQTQQLERAENQATNYFKRTYKFDHEQTAAEVARLETAAHSKKQLQERIQEKLTPLIEEQKTLLLEYQQQKLFADIRSDRQEIYDRLTELEKESLSNSHSVQDNLARLRCERALDTITEQDFHEIIQTVPPQKAQALLELRELEREYDHLRVFQRVR